MDELKPGDRVDCCIRFSSIVSPYRQHDEVRTFEIVATDEFGYYLFVPGYIYIKGSVKADSFQCKVLGINPRFLNEQIIYIQDNLINNVHSVMDGATCSRCKEFYTMAEANQDDGTMICWSCRKDPYR